jgi:hypothetical protein
MEHVGPSRPIAQEVIAKARTDYRERVPSTSTRTEYEYEYREHIPSTEPELETEHRKGEVIGI